jgi:hypothetical protein
LGSDQLSIDDEQLSSELLNHIVMSADGEVYRLYLGPMFAPDQLGRDKLKP